MTASTTRSRLCTLLACLVLPGAFPTSAAIAASPAGADWRVCRAENPVRNQSKYWVLSNAFEVSRYPDWERRLRSEKPWTDAFEMFASDSDSATLTCSGPNPDRQSAEAVRTRMESEVRDANRGLRYEAIRKRDWTVGDVDFAPRPPGTPVGARPVILRWGPLPALTKGFWRERRGGYLMYRWVKAPDTLSFEEFDAKGQSIRQAVLSWRGNQLEQDGMGGSPVTSSDKLHIRWADTSIRLDPSGKSFTITDAAHPERSRSYTALSYEEFQRETGTGSGW